MKRTRLSPAYLVSVVTFCAIAMGWSSFNSIAAGDPSNHDPYCPATDVPEHALAMAVARSPHRATIEIGKAAISVYEAYIACAHRYRTEGNLGTYIFAVAQSADLYAFAARDFDALGMDDMARASLRRGQNVITAALKTKAGDSHFINQLNSSLTEITRLLGQLQ